MTIEWLSLSLAGCYDCERSSTNEILIGERTLQRKFLQTRKVVLTDERRRRCEVQRSRRASGMNGSCVAGKAWEARGGTVGMHIKFNTILSTSFGILRDSSALNTLEINLSLHIARFTSLEDLRHSKPCVPCKPRLKLSR